MNLWLNIIFNRHKTDYLNWYMYVYFGFLVFEVSYSIAFYCWYFFSWNAMPHKLKKISTSWNCGDNDTLCFVIVNHSECIIGLFCVKVVFYQFDRLSALTQGTKKRHIENTSTYFKSTLTFPIRKQQHF